MPFEYKMLCVMTVFFLFAWLPGSMGKYKSYGLPWVISNREPQTGKELLPWAGRAERAYANLKDYFPGFVVAILLLGVTNHFDDSTAIASAIYVSGRLLHFISYVVGHVTARAVFYMLAMGSNLFLIIKLFF